MEEFGICLVDNLYEGLEEEVTHTCQEATTILEEEEELHNSLILLEACKA